MKLYSRFILLLAVAVLCAACSSPPPKTLGLQNDALRPCPDSPNCVSSLRGDVAPLVYSGERAAAQKRLREVILQLPGCSIVSAFDAYIHAACTSALFKFVDDLEVHLPADGGPAQVRSASRLGYSDLGVNRKRVEALRGLFQEDKEMAE